MAGAHIRRREHSIVLGREAEAEAKGAPASSPRVTRLSSVLKWCRDEGSGAWRACSLGSCSAHFGLISHRTWAMADGRMCHSASLHSSFFCCWCCCCFLLLLPFCDRNWQLASYPLLDRAVIVFWFCLLMSGKALVKNQSSG